LNDLLGGPNYGFRLITKEAGRTNIGLKLLRLKSGEVLDGWVLLKQDRSHHVHPDVCALCRKNGCNQQLPCIGMVESAFGIWIHVAQPLQNFPHPLWRSWVVFC